MKTHCPHCEALQSVPNEYANNPVKCKKCGKTFNAVISVPIINPKEPLRRLFPTKFALAALVVASLIVGFTLICRDGYNAGYRAGLETAQLDTFYAQTTYASSRSAYIAGGNLQTLCKALGALEMAAAMKTISLSETTSSNMRGYLAHTITFLRGSILAANAQDVRDHLIAAIEAEIDVLSYQSKPCDDAAKAALLCDEESVRLMTQSMELRANAATELDRLMYKI